MITDDNEVQVFGQFFRLSHFRHTHFLSGSLRLFRALRFNYSYQAGLGHVFFNVEGRRGIARVGSAVC